MIAMANIKRVPGDPYDYGLQYTSLKPYSGQPSTVPRQWRATALLHPFSPPPTDDPSPQVPFFQLCTADIAYCDGQLLSAQITGCEHGTWWYVVYPDRTMVSVDGGRTWTEPDVGWRLPTRNWFGNQTEKAVCAGTSCLNWMQAQVVDWWKVPVTGSRATTWLWFDSDTGLPFRLMFGQPPPHPAVGDPEQLALFQMFSFTYFPSFEVVDRAEVPREWAPSAIPGFRSGNPEGHALVVWNSNFGMTTLMTPVDAASNPLPTRVLYRWAPDPAYRGLPDRAQSTLMWYDHNPASGLVSRTALMFGIAPPVVPLRPHSGSSFLVDRRHDGSATCRSMPLGQQPPWWSRIPEVHGRVQACITNNPALCPGKTIAVISVLFPPTDEYPQGRYLWTWYSPFPGSDGSHARPVTFMESASPIGQGTSLALADYFDYRELGDPIDPDCFAIPIPCRHAPRSPRPEGDHCSGSAHPRQDRAVHLDADSEAC